MKRSYRPVVLVLLALFSPFYCMYGDFRFLTAWPLASRNSLLLAEDPKAVKNSQEDAAQRLSCPSQLAVNVRSSPFYCNFFQDLFQDGHAKKSGAPLCEHPFCIDQWGIGIERESFRFHSWYPIPSHPWPKFPPKGTQNGWKLGQRSSLQNHDHYELTRRVYGGNVYGLNLKYYGFYGLNLKYYGLWQFLADVSIPIYICIKYD